jgi:hypothetical protein
MENLEIAPIERFLYLILIAVLFIFLIYILIDKWLKKRVVKRRFERGKKLEVRARDILTARGYRIIGAQVEFEHDYEVDGEPNSSVIVVDYMAERHDKKYIVEVKTGTSATSIHNGSTRRQLLEYYFAIENDGVLLLDMEKEEIHEIRFISRNKRQNYKWLTITMIFAITAIWIPMITAKLILSSIIVMILIFRKKFFK